MPKTIHDLSVCGEADNPAAALKAIGERQPELVIVDVELVGKDGLDLVKQIKTRHPDNAVLVLSMHEESDYGERAFRVGARAYGTKRQFDDTVLFAIRRLLRGETHMSDDLKAQPAAKFLARRTLDTDSPLDVLSDRELATGSTGPFFLQFSLR